jgi:hypothetical protein
MVGYIRASTYRQPTRISQSNPVGSAAYDTLDRFTNVANRMIKLVQLDETQTRKEAKEFCDCTEEIEGLVERHLADEEDLIVPILLHHKLRG